MTRTNAHRRAHSSTLKRQRVSDIIETVAKMYAVDVAEMRTRPTTPRLMAARKECIRLASKVAGVVIIADMLFCDQTTVRYHKSESYREQKRAYNVRRIARSRTAPGEDRGLDRTVLPG